MDNDTVIQLPITNHSTATEESGVMEMMKGLETLIKVGAIKGPIDDVLKDYEVDLNTGYTKAILKKDSLVDASKLNTIGASNIHEVPKEYMTKVDLSEFEKTFSINTIQERLRYARMNPKQRFRIIIMDYKRYYAAKKNDFKKDPNTFINLKNMFVTDLSGLIKEIIPFIEEGKQLNSLIGVSQVSPNMSKTARDLSLIYRRALKSEKSSGQINKSIFQNLKLIHNQFINELIEVIFPDSSEFQVSVEDKSINPIQDQLAMNEEDELADKNYSYCSDGRVSLFSNNMKRIKLFK